MSEFIYLYNLYTIQNIILHEYKIVSEFIYLYKNIILHEYKI